MRLVFILAVAGLLATAHAADTSKPRMMTFPVNRDPVDVDNEFSRNNPFYKQGAGAFYDTTYVSFSAAQLFDLAHLRPEQMPGALDSIRAFVFDYLDFYVRGNGKITDEQRRTCVVRMDQRFKLLLDDIQYKIYKIWRNDTSGKVNTLNFLIRPDPAPSEDDFGTDAP